MDTQDDAARHLSDTVAFLRGTLHSVRAGINICRATLQDSVDTHGTHGGWLEGEAQRLESEIAEIDAALAQTQGRDEKTSERK